VADTAEEKGIVVEGDCAAESAKDETEDVSTGSTIEERVGPAERVKAWLGKTLFVVLADVEVEALRTTAELALL